MISSGSSTFFCDRPPVHQDGRLEDHPVVAIEARLGGRLAVDRDRARRGRDQVADDPQQRRLAATGRADQRRRTRPGRSPGRSIERLDSTGTAIEASARHRPARRPGWTRSRGDSVSVMPSRSTSGARPRITWRSTRLTSDEGADAQDRADDDRRPEVRSGPERVVLHPGQDLRGPGRRSIPDGSSPTIAPTIEAVAAILNAVNRYGGRRRQAELPEDRPPAGGVRTHQLVGPRVDRRAGRGWRRS